MVIRFLRAVVFTVTVLALVNTPASRHYSLPDWVCHGKDIPRAAIIGDCYVFVDVDKTRLG